MKVKIGNKIYDSNKEPIMLILDEKDKSNIDKMQKDKFKFITFPATMNLEDVQSWINELVNEEERKEVENRKIKVSALDPVGIIVGKSEEIDYSYVGCNNPPELQKKEKILGIEQEPMRHIRYLIEIGDYTYFFRRDGQIIDYVTGPRKINIEQTL